MQVLSLITLPSSIPLGLLSGQYGQQAVLEELNASWRNSGSGVIFGTDSFGEKFRAFSNMLGERIETVKNTVLKTVEAVCCPNKFQEITCQDDLYHVPACMFIPLLTEPSGDECRESSVRSSYWELSFPHRSLRFFEALAVRSCRNSWEMKARCWILPTCLTA